MHLLDFPDYILEIILHHLATSIPSTTPTSLPFTILPISTTCKRLHYLCSTLISTDALFRPHFPHLQRSKITHCQYLATTLTPTKTDNSFIVCKTQPCHELHRLLAWYSFSIRGLISLNFEYLSYHLPLREAYTLLRRLQSENHVLKEIRVGNNYHLHRVNNPLICALKDVISKSAHRLRVLSICLEDEEIVREVLRYDMYKLEHLSVKFNECAGNFNAQLETCKKLLQRTEVVGGRMKKLTIRGQVGCMQYLWEICEICSSLEELDVGVVNGRAPFPAQMDLDALGIRKMYLWCFEMDEDQLELFATQVVAATKLEVVYVHFSKLQTLTRVLERFGEPLQRKICSL